MGLLVILCLVLMLSKSSLETPTKYDKNEEVYPRTYKREAASSKSRNKDVHGLANEFVEEKLIEYGQALEHLVKLVQKNEKLTRKLLEKQYDKNNADKPDLPEKVEFSGRRSGGQDDVSPAARGEKGNPWCLTAYLCRKTGDPVCGFDDSYGYGKFKDICHMFEVNCYWEYSFLLSPACHKMD